MSKPGGSARVGWGVAALPFLWFAARAAQTARMPLLAALILAAALAWLAGIPLQRSVAIRWSWPGRTWYVGDTAPFTVTVTNNGKWATPVLTFEQTSRGLAIPAITVPALQPGESSAVTVPLALAGRRARQPLTWRSQGHNRLVGLGVATESRTGAENLFAVRPWPDLPPASVMHRLSVPRDDGLPSGARGGADPLLLRQFASGDPVSAVHWRSTARAGTPVVLERERPSGSMVVLLVCAGYDGPAWEATIARAAGLIEACRAAGTPVEIVVPYPAAPLSGSPSYDAFQDWLTCLEQVGPAQPEIVELAVQYAAGGVVAVVSSEPWLAAEVARAGPHVQVLDLALPW